MMKIALCLLGLICLQTALALTPSLALREEWKAWKEEHGKNYSTNSTAVELSQEEIYRFRIWMENKAAIDKHNKEFDEGVHTYTLVLNEFSDLSGEEFVAMMTGFRASFQTNRSQSLLPAKLASLPESVNWVEKGAVTEVKNQGNTCGACWAFSATGGLEGAYFIKYHKLVSFSEQQLIDCCKDSGCIGGDHTRAFTYIQINGGLDTEKSYPYTGKDEKCHYDKENLGATINVVVTLPTGDETSLLEAVAQKLDHGVLVVGYGRCDKTGKKYWLIKNSWGSKWGEKGYFRLARDENNMCGVASVASYPVL